MRIGKLDRLITIQESSDSRGSSGEVVKVWSTFAQVYAAKVDQTTKEAMAADQVERATLRTLWRIRYLSGVKNSMRILYDGDYYDIEGIMERGRRWSLELMSVRVQA